ncbi:hypothetical protein TB2_032926 [Malus domestica]
MKMMRMKDTESMRITTKISDISIRRCLKVESLIDYQNISEPLKMQPFKRAPQISTLGWIGISSSSLIASSKQPARLRRSVSYPPPQDRYDYMPIKPQCELSGLDNTRPLYLFQFTYGSAFIHE